MKTVVRTIAALCLLLAVASAWATTMDQANQLLLDASEDALAYVYTGDSGSRDKYLEKMKEVDQAIAEFSKKGDRHMAAVLKKRREEVGRAAKKMFNGYVDNDADLGLQARAFQDASDKLDNAMQEAVDGQEASDQQPQDAVAQGDLLVDLMEYQMHLTIAGISGLYYASGGPADQKQVFKDAMAGLDAIGPQLQTAATDAGLADDPQTANLLAALGRAKQGLVQAAAQAFAQREADGKADAATLELFKQAEQELLSALAEGK